MKKKVISALLCTAMIATMVAGCGSGNSDGGSSDSGNSGSSSSSGDDQSSDEDAGGEGGGSGTYAIVTKAAGNPFNEKTAEGFQEVIEAAGGTAIVKIGRASCRERVFTGV